MQAMTSQEAGQPAVAAVYLLVLGLALAASPTPSDSVLPVRLVVLGTGLALGLVAKPRGRTPRPVLIAMGLAVAVFVAAAFFGATPLLSILGRYPRYEGLPVVLGYAAALVVGARLLGPGSARLRVHTINALVLSSLALAVVALVQWASAPDLRVTSALGNSTTLGTFSLVALAMLAWSLQDWSGWRFAGVIGAVSCLVLSASRGALLGAVVAAFAVLLVRRWSRRPGRWWWGPAIAAVLLGAAWLAPGTRARLSGTTPFADSTIGGRLLLWQESTALVGTHPVLGVGPSRFVDSIGAFHTTAWAAQVGPYAPPDSPHNVVLQVLAGTGWLGLAGVVAVAVAVAAALWATRPWDPWQAGTVLATTAVAVSYLTSFTDPVTLTVVLLLLGGAISVPDRADPQRAVRTTGLVAGVAALSLGLWLGGTAVVAEFRFSSAVTVTSGTTRALLGVPGVRPWDADLARRVGYSGARLAEAGTVDPDALVAMVDDACARLPGSVECLHVLADLKDLGGHHEQALAVLDRALALDPTNVDTILRRGVALGELARYEEAIRAFEQAAELRPDAAEPWEDLAEVYTRQGRGADADAARARADQLRHR